MTLLRPPSPRRRRTAITTLSGLVLGAVLAQVACGDSSSPAGHSGPSPIGTGGSSTGGSTNPTCRAGAWDGPVQKPELVKNLDGQTSWFASPVIADLDGDGKNELIAAYYSVYVYDSSLKLLDKAEVGEGRVYAPHVVADLEGDGVTDIVYGNDYQVFAFEWRGSSGEFVGADWRVSGLARRQGPVG